VADTSAAHGGWAEATGYAAATRAAWTAGAISGTAPASIDNSAAPASFVITANATIAGAFMIDSAVKGGAVGTLLGEGNFTSGDRSVLIADTLNVTVTCTMT
jgi:hypothetical protein